MDIPVADAHNEALITAIHPAPDVQPGPGRVVMSTFKHTADEILELTIEGEPEPIRTTPEHPFWSEDEQWFVRADRLAVEDSLQGLVTGSRQVISDVATKEAQLIVVRNLEIHGENTFRVGASGLLVHNAGYESGDSTTVGYSKAYAQNFDGIFGSKSSPFIHRVRPGISGRPDPDWSIDTSTFTTWTSTSQKGFPRNSKEFWLAWERMRPETLSPENRALIHGLDPRTGKQIVRTIKKGKNAGRAVAVEHVAPRVDDTWIKHFGEHKEFKWQTIEHHHVDEGRYAIPLPWQLHRGEGNYNIWHGVHQ